MDVPIQRILDSKDDSGSEASDSGVSVTTFFYQGRGVDKGKTRQRGDSKSRTNDDGSDDLVLPNTGPRKDTKPRPEDFLDIETNSGTQSNAGTKRVTTNSVSRFAGLLQRTGRHRNLRSNSDNSEHNAQHTRGYFNRARNLFRGIWAHAEAVRGNDDVRRREDLVTPGLRASPHTSRVSEYIAPAKSKLFIAIAGPSTSERNSPRRDCSHTTQVDDNVSGAGSGSIRSETSDNPIVNALCFCIWPCFDACIERNHAAGPAEVVPEPAQTSVAPLPGAAGSSPADMQGAASSSHQAAGAAEIPTDSASTPRHTYPPSSRMPTAVELSTRARFPGTSSARVDTAEGLCPRSQATGSPSA
ncbi:hypothetical protein CONPUDRAFT_146917 [Coniophora puteana RWD-64-598 SS2]|uniref:Uncharacterized protein n=1 Tax=Coniophora puteana (strain RWD-64-598) TaxID=741705 RepID=A0A5M3M9K2_CONPW|nr:uncharacterized protein CONPUDRAFT_146917 [Coniophora puteana RWD-64-598 SS2]EIW75783.1 hypothetical protein CONPUDRAFT_146917 [Coniophora puteana RWD-64-598 SS2]